jgi:sucrose-6-phosphate hydrolase SacC (GH32 family)
VTGSVLKIIPEESTNSLSLQIFLDKSILEIFINDGRQTITKVIYPPQKDLGIEVYTNVKASVDVWQIKHSTW